MKEDMGFTIIEVIIVVALIGILSGIAMPQLNQMRPAMEVNAATRQIISEMLLLKVRAISENRKYRIIFGKPGEGQYQIQQDGNRDDDYQDAVDTIVRTESLPSSIIFGANVSKNTSGNKICDDGICFGSDNGASFKPLGTSDDGSVYLIPEDDKLNGRTDRMRAISVNSAGRIKAWRYYAENRSWNKY